jgi:DNA-binding GntR family transcriptional regulator
MKRDAAATTPAAMPAKRGTGRETAYQVLRGHILDLTLEPGAALDEASLLRELRLSRTPLREALVRLASEQLVELLPNRGARVAEISAGKLAAYFEALALAQRATHRWAAMRRTVDDLARIGDRMTEFAEIARKDPARTPGLNRAFHSAIASACQNAHFIQLYEGLLDQGLRLARLTVIDTAPEGVTPEMHIETLIHEHANITAAIADGDAELSDHLAGVHNDLFRRRVFDYFLNRHATALDQVPVLARG